MKHVVADATGSALRTSSSGSFKCQHKRQAPGAERRYVQQPTCKDAQYAKRLPAKLACAAALTGDPDAHARTRDLDLLKILQGMQGLVTRSQKRRVQWKTCTWRRRKELHG